MEKEGFRAGMKSVWIPATIELNPSSFKTITMETITRDKDLELFLVDALQKLYWAEQRRVSLLRGLKENSFSPGLTSAIELQETQVVDQLERLQQVFQLLKQDARVRTCEAFEGILKDAEVMALNKKRKTRVRDFSIMTSLERIVHYMMASYAMVIHVSGTLDLPEAAGLLQSSLQKEHAADDALSSLVNQ